MDRKRGIALLIFLVLLLGMIDAAWIVLIRRTITAEIVGGSEKVYDISPDFWETLSLDTSSGPYSNSTFMIIKNLGEDIDMLYEIETRVTSLDSDCPNFKEDCDVIVTQVFSNGTRIILSHTNNYNVEEEANNVTFYSGLENKIEYKIDCIENSCPQRINSTISLTEIV